jgi:hypothetical protein
MSPICDALLVGSFEIVKTIERIGGRIKNDLGNSQKPTSSGNQVILGHIQANPEQQHFNPNLSDPNHAIYQHLGIGSTSNYINEINLESQQVALDIFSQLLTEDERNRFEQRYKQHLDNPGILAVYGTSGTENNGKELLNTIGFVANCYDQAKKAGHNVTGVYFVEDNGHSALNALLEAFRFCTDDLYSFEAFENSLRQYIHPSQTGSAITLTENLSSLLIETFKTLNLKPFIKEAIEDMIVELQGSSLADLVAAIQSFSFMYMGYRLYGVDDMPIIITSTFSQASQATKSSLSITKYSQLMQGMYAPTVTNKDERTPLFNFIDESGRDIPVFDNDIALFMELVNSPESSIECLVSRHFTEINEQKKTKHKLEPNKPEEKISQETQRINMILKFINKKFGNLQNFLNATLDQWTFGGVSGKGYYALINLMGQSLPMILFLDNYERNGPHKALIHVAEHRPGDLHVFNYSPDTRVWAVHLEIDPTNGDKNGSIGMAIPSWLAINSLWDMPKESLQGLKHCIGSSQKMGLSDQMAVIFFSQSGGCFIVELPDPRAFLDAKYLDLGGAKISESILQELNKIRLKVIERIISDDSQNLNISNLVSALLDSEIREIRDSYNFEIEGLPPVPRLSEISNLSNYMSTIDGLLIKLSEQRRNIFIRNSGQNNNEVNTVQEDNPTTIKQREQELRRLKFFLMYIKALWDVFRPLEES